MPTPEAIAEARRLAESLASDPLNPVRVAAEQVIAQAEAAAGAASDVATRAATTGAAGGAAAVQQEGINTAAQGITTQLSSTPATPQDRAARARGLRTAYESIRNNPGIPEALRSQLEESLAQAEMEAAQQEDMRQGAAEFSGSIVGQDETVDAVTGRPVPGYVQRMVRDQNSTYGTPPSLARDQVTAMPGEAPAAGGVPGEATPGPGGAHRGAGGRPQTVSAAEQLLASLQSGTPDEQDRLLQNLVDSYRREATTRQDFGDQGSVVVDEGLLAQEELARARQEEFQQELIDQERRLQEIDTALGVLSSTRFDANRLFTDRGLATSMALGVAVNAATSLAQNALFPGANAGNTALQIVNGAIERDIQTQMVNFERGVQSVQGMRTAYEMARNLSGDRQAAYEFATAVSQRRVGEQLRSMAMQTQGLVAREQLMRQADDLLLQAAQREEMARMQMAQAMMAARPRGGSGGARTAGDGTGRAFAPFAVRTARAAGLTRAEIVKALNPTTVSRLEEGLNGTAEALDILDEIQNQLGTYSSWSLVDRAVMSQLISSYQNAFRQASGMGALDQGALTLMEKILANPNDVTTPISSFRAQLRSARARLVRTARRQVNTLGDGLIEWDPRSDPTGATVSGGGNELGEGATVVGEPTAGSENTMTGVLGQAGVEGTLRAADTAIAESTDPTATVVRGFTQAVAPGAFRGN